MHLVNTTRRRWVSGWKLFGATVLALLAAIWLDARIKSQAPAIGYCPPAAESIVYGTDFGAFWGHALNTRQVQRIRGDWRRAEAGIELAIRNSTGIRPTPSRWRLWMGHRFLASSSPQGYGVCTYPGLLLRGFGKLHERLHDPIDESGVRVYGELHYAWRDGFLIASRDAEYVRESLEADPIAMEEGMPERVLAFESRTDPRMSLKVFAADEFPIMGRIPVAITQRDAPMTLPSAWQPPPMAASTATTWGDLADVLSVFDATLARSERWRTLRQSATDLFDEWQLESPPRTWPHERLDHCAVALHGFDLDTNVPYPELAYIVRSTLPVAGEHPLAGVLPDDIEGIAYEWGGYPGKLFPMTGAQWAPCLGHVGRDWLAASRERLMREMVDELGDGIPHNADFTLHIDWEQVSSALSRMIALNESFELVPEMSRDELRSKFGPIAEALQHIGRTVILGRHVDGGMEIDGRLAISVPEDAS